MAQTLPYLVWANAVELAMTDENVLHMIVLAERTGAFGRDARLHIRAAMTQAMQAQFSSVYAHFPNVVAVRTMAVVQNAPIRPMSAVDPYFNHGTANCLDCFRFLESYGIISVTGFYDRAGSYFRQANINGNVALQDYMIRQFPLSALFTDIGMDQDGMHYILGTVADNRQLVEAFVRRGETFIGRVNNWSNLITNRQLLRMAPWIGLNMARRLNARGVHLVHAHEVVSRGGSRDSWIWHELIITRNPQRIALFKLMHEDVAVPAGLGVNQTSEAGWDGGTWHPWATAIKFGDRPAALWFSRHANPLVLSDSTHIIRGAVAATAPAPTIYTPAPNTKFIGYAATLSITADNLHFLRQWVRAASQPLTLRFFRMTDLVKARLAYRITDMLEQIILNMSRQRSAISADATLTPRTKARRRKMIADIAVGMLIEIIGNLLRIEADGVVNNISNFREYREWLDSLKRSGIPEITTILRVLEQPRIETRSGRY